MLLVTGCAARPSFIINAETCDRLAQDPLFHDFMEEWRTNPFTSEVMVEVLRFTSQREIPHTDEELRCEGMVKWNDATKDDIEFRAWVDTEGDE